MDSKIFRFVSSKEESLFLQRKNPRKFAWTQIYRRVNRKGVSEEVAKKRSRRTVKHNRGIAGISLDQLKERRSQYTFALGGMSAVDGYASGSRSDLRERDILPAR